MDSAMSSRPRRAGVNYGTISAQSTPEKFSRSILTQRRKTWIHEFQKRNQKDVGSTTWIKQLELFLKQKDSIISMEDIQRWIKKHNWITQAHDISKSESEEDSPAKNEDLTVLENSAMDIEEEETLYLSSIDIDIFDVDAA